MFTLTNVEILGSSFDNARRLGFLDRARQREEERATSVSTRLLVTDKFPIREGVDLLINGFGKEYANGYRLGVAESSQPVGKDNVSGSDSDGEDTRWTVGEAFRNNIKASIRKDCKVLRAKIEESMKQGMEEYTMRKATDKFARIYGWDVVFNINSPQKTRTEINSRIKREANEMCKKLRKTRKWNSYPSHAVEETLRRIKNRIVDTGISEYAKRKIEKAKKSAQKAVFVDEDKIVRDAMAATENIRKFCQEWKAEIERWKREFTDPIPKEAIFVENHEHMANEVAKFFPIMHLLFPEFEISEKLSEHELWADAVALADPYADNHPDYKSLEFLRGWSAGGIKLLLMHMQRQMNKIENTFEEIIVVDPEFVDEVIDQREENLAKKKQLEELRAKEAEEKRRLEKHKRKKQRELAQANKAKAERKREKKRKELLTQKREAKKKERATQEAAALLRKANLEQLAENLDKANEARRKRATQKAVKIPLTAKEFVERRAAYKEAYKRGPSSEEDDSEPEESEEDEIVDNTRELEQDIAKTNKAIASRQAVVASAGASLENIQAGPSASEIIANAKKTPAWHEYTPEKEETMTSSVARYDELDLLFNDTNDIETLEKIRGDVITDLQEFAHEEKVKDLLQRIEQKIEEKKKKEEESSGGSDFDESYNNATQENNEAENIIYDIIYEDAENGVESLWAAMKLKDKYFKSDKQRLKIVDQLIHNFYTKIEESEFFNKIFVEEVLAFYKKAGKPNSDLRTRWELILQHKPSSLESSLGGSSVRPPVAQAIPVATAVATAWTLDHVKQHKEHYARAMFKKCASLVSRFAPKKLRMKFAPKPASVEFSVAIPVASAKAHVFETKKFAPVKIHLDADAPMYPSDIMSRGNSQKV